MRVPISWLRDYVDIDIGTDELADLLTNAGLEVGKIDLLGGPGADLVWDRDKVRWARVLEVRRHPDADRLVLATVDYGADQSKQVVTGAPNLVPYVDRGDLTELDLMSPILLEGGTYYDPYKDHRKTKLKGKALRGIHNDAMLCSEIELGLGDDADGIVLVPRHEIGCAVEPGAPLQDSMADAVLDIDIIPNVARCASMIGTAREVAALTGKTLRPPPYEVLMEGAPLDGAVVIETESPELNPRFVAYLIEGVEQKPAPLWMRHRLQLAGQRPINVVVDISNYVMLEVGQPNHTFDYDFLRRRADQYAPDGPVRLITRLAHDSETLTTLDGTERKLYPNNILVTDPLGNLSVGGIMGGAESEIQPVTENVLLEAAAWNFLNIRQSARQLGLQSEAGFRFSRGVHPSQAMLGAQRAAELLRELAGGTVRNGVVDYYPAPAPQVTVTLDRDDVNRRSGLTLTSEEIAGHLRKLEFTVESADGGDDAILRVQPPDHRLDIEGPHDLLEEVCRMAGYDQLPSTVLRDALPRQRGNRSYELEEQVKDLLVELGLQEVITYRLTTPEAEARLRWVAKPTPYVRVQNPSTADRVVMRQRLLASVLEVAASNLRFTNSVALFELGQVFPIRDGSLPEEHAGLAIVLSGAATPATWSGSPTALDFFDLKGLVEELGARLHLELTYDTGEHPSYRPGRTGRILLGGSPVGWLGELHPEVVEECDLRVEAGQPVLAAELELEPLLAQVPDAVPVASVPAFPGIREDLALVVDEALPAAQLAAEIQQAGAPLLYELELFDVYRGDKVGAGKKSLAYHLLLQAPNRTLRDKDAGKLRRRILAHVEKTVGATLRE